MVYDVENLFNARPAQNVAQAQTSQTQANPARVDANIGQNNVQNFAQNIASANIATAQLQTSAPRAAQPTIADYVENATQNPQKNPAQARNIAGNDRISEQTSSDIPVSTRAPSRQSFLSNPLDVEGAFARLGELLVSHTRQSLERNYQGRGSLLNVVA